MVWALTSWPPTSSTSAEMLAALTTLHCSKVSFLQWCHLKRYTKIFTKMRGVLTSVRHIYIYIYTLYIYISESMLKCVPIASLYTLRVCFYFTDLRLQHCFYTAYRMSYFTQVILTLWKKSLSCNIARRRAVPIKYSACIRTLIIRIIPYPVNSEWPVFAGELWLQLFLGYVQSNSLDGRWQKHKSSQNHVADSEHLISFVPGETVVSLLISAVH